VLRASTAAAGASSSSSAAGGAPPHLNLFSHDGPFSSELERADFDVFAYTADQLLPVCVRMLERHRVLERLAIDGAVMGNFLRSGMSCRAGLC
jgi:hypothetical protein